MAQVSSSVAKTIRAIPKTREAHFSYKPQCETCIANTLCMGCTHPACSWCYESRCDAKRDLAHGPDCYCEVRCKSRIGLQFWLNQSRGLYPNGIRVKNMQPIALPSILPIVNSFTQEARSLLAPWTYVIPINTFIRQDNSVPDYVYRLRELFPEGSQLILSFCVQDQYIERIWEGRTSGGRAGSPGWGRRQFWRSSWFDQFDAVMGVNYSVYWPDPQMEIMYAIRRTMITTQEMDEAGLNVLPLVIWYTDKEAWPQLDCYVKQGADTVVVNFQYVSGAQIASYKHDLPILEAIARAYPHLRVICYGIQAPYVIDEARRILGPERLVIAAAGPLFTAIKSPVGVNQKRQIFQEGVSRIARIIREGADPTRDFIRPIFRRASAPTADGGAEGDLG